RHAEELGLDMVTISDHLHGVRTWEPWTVLTWIAAGTSRIRVSPNVLGLPYRHPAVIAKMAETLHRLSEGRVVLGIGAGGSDAEFEAFGLPVRSPGEKVDAFEEALRIIRGLWEEETFSFRGEHYAVEEARIEPRPGHIPIWIGAYGDRMIELTGRYADGWLPSLMYVSLDRAAGKMEQLRAAAEAAGRDPAEITMAVNVWARIEDGAEPRRGQIAGGVDRVVEETARVLEAGFDHLNFTVSGEEQRARLAEEVLPGL
ncbi:MAG TPA: LLM class flavin-dependent oxidoreductase, partial [Actinomycetota bacterium]